MKDSDNYAKVRGLVVLISVALLSSKVMCEVLKGAEADSAPGTVES